MKLKEIKYRNLNLNLLKKELLSIIHSYIDYKVNLEIIYTTGINNFEGKIIEMSPQNFVIFLNGNLTFPQIIEILSHEAVHIIKKTSEHPKGFFELVNEIKEKLISRLK